MGTTLTAALVEGDGVTHGARGRQPRLPAARRRARAAHPRPLAGGGAGAQRPAHRRGRRAPPAALDHHPRAGPGARRGGGRPHPHGARRRRLPAVLGRPDRAWSPTTRWRPSCARPSRLEDAAEALVRAANQSGGKDNITVVLFRVAEADGARPAAEDTLSGERDDPPGPDRGRRAGRGGASRSGPPPRRADRAARRRGERAAGAPAPAGGRALRRVLAALAAVVVLAAGRGGRGRRRRGRCTSWAPTTPAWSRSTAACPTTCRSASSCTPSSTPAACPARTIGRARRERLLDHEWRSRADAEDLVRQLERGTLDTGSTPVSARTRELFGLIPVSLLVSAGFAAVLVTPHRGRERRHRHLRPGLPRPVRVRAPVHPRAAARRRPLPVPAGGDAGGVRAGGDLPDRRRAGARAGAVVRDRADRLLRHDRLPARPPRARALPLHDRRGGDRAAGDAAPAGHRRRR